MSSLGVGEHGQGPRYTLYTDLTAGWSDTCTGLRTLNRLPCSLHHCTFYHIDRCTVCGPMTICVVSMFWRVVVGAEITFKKFTIMLNSAIFIPISKTNS